MYRPIRRLPATLAALTLFAVPGWAQEAETPAETAPAADTVVATVNGTDITLGEMIILRAQLPADYNQLPPEVLFSGILDQLVNQQLLADTLEQAPDRVEYALRNEERSLRAGEVVTSLGATVSEEAIREAYEARFEGQEPSTEYNASHILLETEEEAQAVIEEIEQGTDFALLARERSTGPSGPNGGQLGWFGPGRMVPAFEEAVTSLEVGEVSAPVETQFGWHVVRLNDTRDEVRPTLEELRPEIEGELRNDLIAARIEELAAEAEIARPGAEGIDPSVIMNVDLLDE